MPRTDTYDKARPFIAEYAVKHGKPPTVDVLAAWFASEHDATPSRETLRRALQDYRTAMAATTPADASALSLAQTMFAQARAQAKTEADERLSVERDAIERNASERIAEAERTAKVAVEKAELDLAEAKDHATRAQERAKVIEEHLQRALSEAAVRNETLTNALLAASLKIGELVAERDAAHLQVAEMISQMRSLESAHHERLQALEARVAAANTKSDEREARSAEQFKALSHSSGMEISRQREKIAELEKALLAARVDKDLAINQARREVTDVIANQLKELATTVGGVNQVHNAHMGGLRTQLEATISKLDGLAARLDERSRASQEALPSPTAKRARK